MGAEYTKSQKRASDKYMERMARIQVIVPKDKAELYKIAAKNAGKSVSKYLSDLADESIAQN